MGYYLQIDTDDAEPLASLTGWGDVIRWADTLPLVRSLSLRHLCKFGWQDDPVLLKIELEEFLKTDPPHDPQTKETVINLLSLLTAHKTKITVVSVTEGFSSEGLESET